jgi:copper oxidase (laccase) domain-containing protein
VNFQTFPPGDCDFENIIFPQQTHSTNIKEVMTGEEDLLDCDGLFTRNPDLILGIKTADCAPVVFIGEEKFGIVHAGWRGLVNGILENMLDVFSDDCLHKIWVGPLHTSFEIQKDDCYAKIKEGFEEEFFDEEEGVILFRFLDAIKSVLPEHAECSEESTFHNRKWASWRRQKDLSDGQNITVVGFF